MAVVATLVLHAPLWWACRRIVAHLAGSRGVFLHRDTFVAVCAAWFVEVLLLGSFGILTAPVILVAHLGIAALSWWSLDRVDASASRCDSVNSTAIGSLAALALATVAVRTLELPDPYDSLTYHLWFPAVWFGESRLDWVPTTFGDLAPTYAPSFLQQFYLGLLYPFGHDAWARIGQLPFLFLLFVSSAELVRGRRQDGPSAWAWGVAAVVVLSAELWSQATSSLADVGAAALFVTTLAYLERSERRGCVLLAGVTAGLFVASRYTSLVYLPVLILAAGIRVRRGRMLFASALLLFAIYPYARNFISTGNPVFPLQLDLGFAVLPGLYTDEAVMTSPFRYRSIAELWRDLTLTFGFSGWICILSAIGVSTFSRSRDGVRMARYWLLLALGACALHFLLVPYDRNLRFLFPAWVLLVVAAGTAWPTGRASIGFGITLGAATVAESLTKIPDWLFRDLDPGRWPWYATPTMALLLGVAIAAFGGTLGWIVASRRKIERQVGGVLLVLAAALTLGGLDAERKRRWPAIYAASARYREFVQGLTSLHSAPAGTRVVYVGRNLPYLVRGEQPGIDVFTLPTDGAEHGNVPHAHLQPNIEASRTSTQVAPDRLDQNFDDWWRGIERERVDRVVIFGRPTLIPGMAFRETPVERAWLVNSPRCVRIWPASLPSTQERLPAIEIFKVSR